jgi:hypothetical protein
LVFLVACLFLTGREGREVMAAEIAFTITEFH